MKSDHTHLSQRLLDAAGQAFSEKSYEQVKLRSIAGDVGVNMAMIRYYYKNKLGLFEAVYAERAKLLHQHLDQYQQAQGDGHSIGSLLELYYQIMAQHPGLPRQLFLLLESQPNAPQTQVVVRHILPLLKRMWRLTAQAAPTEGFSPQLWVSFHSLMIFPFLMPSLMREELGIELTPEFLSELAKQNKQLINKLL